MTIQLKTNRQIATYCWLDIEFRTYRRFLDETNKITFEIQLCLALKNFLLSLFSKCWIRLWVNFIAMQKLWLDGVYAKINRFQPILPDFLMTQSLEISIFVLTKQFFIRIFWMDFVLYEFVYTLKPQWFWFGTFGQFSWKVNWRNGNNYVLLFAICPWIFYWCFS